MNTTIYEVLGAFLITILALAGKFVENSSLFFAARNAASGERNLTALYYECCNFHLHLSLGMLGLAWSRDWDSQMCIPLVVLIVIGFVMKGVFADSRPSTLNFLNGDAFRGLYFPNCLAIVCVIWVIAGKPILSLLPENVNAPTQVIDTSKNVK
jgi:hypothetical protein